MPVTVCIYNDGKKPPTRGGEREEVNEAAASNVCGFTAV